MRCVSQDPARSQAMSEKITQIQAHTISEAFLSYGEVFEMMADFDEARIERILKEPTMAHMMNTPQAKRLLDLGPDGK